MKYNIVPNESRKTLTLVLTPVSINYTDYLFKKYKDEKYFASGVLRGADYKEHIMPFVTDLANKLTILGQGVLPPTAKITTNDLITLQDEEYRFITRNLDKEGNWDKQFKVNLTNRAKDGEKRFLFLDLDQTKTISQTDSWKHNYAVEIELGVGYDEKTAKPYVFAIFHRGISVGLKDNNSFQQNNNAWKGFNVDTPSESKNLAPIEVADEDLPF
jgi:hypothetical protein